MKAASLLGVNSYAAVYYYEQLQKQLLQEGATVFVYLHSSRHDEKTGCAYGRGLC